MSFYDDISIPFKYDMEQQLHNDIETGNKAGFKWVHVKGMLLKFQ